jgi:hypothetical protein
MLTHRYYAANYYCYCSSAGGRDGLVLTFDSSLKPVGVQIDLSADADNDGVADCGTLNCSVVSVHCGEKSY